MQWFKNMKVRTKMILSFLLVVALLLALAVVAVLEMSNVDHLYEVAIHNPIRVKECVMQTQLNYRDARRLTSLMAAYTGQDLEACEGYYKDGLAAIEAANTWLGEFEKAVVSNPFFAQADKDTRVAKGNSVKEMLAQYKTELLDNMITVARAGDRDRALELLTHGAPIADDIRETTAGMLATSETTSQDYINNAKDGANQTTLITVIIAVVAVIVAVVVALYVAGYFSGLLVPCAAFLKKVGSTGDLTLEARDQAGIAAYSQNKDEIGNLTAGIVAFVSRVTDIAKELETVAGGDLTSDIKPLSNSDVMGNSLQKMVGNLNNMFGEINNSTSQVSAGAKQVADGSQALAQGSTEQAASVEQLSSSISEIADKTKTNAEMAGRAA
ncbi:MAG: methyl-accepting chemotaxis protein, partial [Oscillospiraceae bacterium]|nr:methyl-accepting chemotaxis protein [Oscillospiraceae bacterium]